MLKIMVDIPDHLSDLKYNVNSRTFHFGILQSDLGGHPTKTFKYFLSSQSMHVMNNINILYIVLYSK